MPEKGRWCRSSHRGKNRPYRPCGCAECPHRTVRRVSPLCADFRSDSECVRGATGKANVAPTCGQRRKIQVQYASPTQRIPATAGKILPFGRSQHRIWLVAGVPAPCQMPQIGQKPIPTTSSQSPLRVYRPAGEGIPRSAPLLLSSKQNPLRWAFVW